MKILVIDNTVDPASWGASEIVGLCTSTRPSCSVSVRRSIQNDLPTQTETYTSLVLTGSLTSAEDRSPWTLALEDFIRHWVRSQRPLLGICFGHQILARAFGAAVGLSQIPERGWIEIIQKRTNPILRGLGTQFTTFGWHRDEVASVPSGFNCFAASKDCAIQGLEFEGLPVFGLQFHPERLPQNVKKNSATGNPTLYDPRIGKTIFENFLSL